MTYKLTQRVENTVPPLKLHVAVSHPLVVPPLGAVHTPEGCVVVPPSVPLTSYGRPALWTPPLLQGRNLAIY